MYVTTKLSRDILDGIAHTVARQTYAGNLRTEVEYVRASRGGRSTYRVKLNAPFSRAAGARRSWSGRRGPWSCWHVFRDVFAAWLAVDPDAVIRTGMATYRGAADFLDLFPETAWRNIGSLAAPMASAEACDCRTADDGPYVDALAEIVRAAA